VETYISDLVSEIHQYAALCAEIHHSASNLQPIRARRITGGQRGPFTKLTVSFGVWKDSQTYALVWMADFSLRVGNLRIIAAYGQKHRFFQLSFLRLMFFFDSES
jgi:hypothetical protein